jgi:hypothetical protein
MAIPLGLSDVESLCLYSFIACRSCLDEAYRNNLKTLAFPPIGTGGYSLSPGVAAKVLDAVFINVYTCGDTQLSTCALVGLAALWVATHCMHWNTMKTYCSSVCLQVHAGRSYACRSDCHYALFHCYTSKLYAGLACFFLLNALFIHKFPLDVILSAYKATVGAPLPHSSGGTVNYQRCIAQQAREPGSSCFCLQDSEWPCI